MSSNRSVPFLMGALVAAVVVPLFTQSPQPVFAQQAGNAGMFAVTAPGNGQGQNILFLVDSQAMRLMVYEHRAGAALTLTQVRNFEPETQFPLQWPPAKANKQFPPVETMRDEVLKAIKRAK